MNLADPMRSYFQQNCFIGKRKIKEDGKEYNLLPMDRVTDISEKKQQKYVSSDSQP